MEEREGERTSPPIAVVILLVVKGGKGLRKVQSQVSAPTSMGGEGPMFAINTRGIYGTP